MHIDPRAPISKFRFLTKISANAYKKALVAVLMAGFITSAPDAFAQNTLPSHIENAPKIDMNWSDARKPRPMSFSQLRAKLRPADEYAALYALQIALNRVGDGQTYIWGRPKRQLRALISPLRSFRAKNGTICRKIIVSLTLGNTLKRIRTTACRANNKRWQIQS